MNVKSTAKLLLALCVGLSFALPAFSQELRLGNAVATSFSADNLTSGTVPAARLPALAPLLSGGAGTLNLSGYAVALPAASVVSAMAGANIAPNKVTAAAGVYVVPGVGIATDGNGTLLLQRDGQTRAYFGGNGKFSIAYGTGFSIDYGDFTMAGNATINGELHATTLYGDGSHLTGITGGGGSGATAAQGAKADSAVQPNTSPTFTSIATIGTVTSAGSPAVLVVDGAAGIGDNSKAVRGTTQAWATVTAALGAAQGGDRILVRSGTYSMLTHALVTQDNLTIEGQAGAKIYSPGDTFMVSGNGVTIRNLEIYGDGSGKVVGHDYDNGFITSSKPGLLVENCYFHDYCGSAMRIIGNVSGTVVRNNRIVNCTAGIHVAASGHTVSNVQIADNHLLNISGFAGSATRGIRLSSVTEPYQVLYSRVSRNEVLNDTGTEIDGLGIEWFGGALNNRTYPFRYVTGESNVVQGYKFSISYNACKDVVSRGNYVVAGSFCGIEFPNVLDLVSEGDVVDSRDVLTASGFAISNNSGDEDHDANITLIGCTVVGKIGGGGCVGVYYANRIRVMGCRLQPTTDAVAVNTQNCHSVEVTHCTIDQRAYRHYALTTDFVRGGDSVVFSDNVLLYGGPAAHDTVVHISSLAGQKNLASLILTNNTCDCTSATAGYVAVTSVLPTTQLIAGNIGAMSGGWPESAGTAVAGAYNNTLTLRNPALAQVGNATGISFAPNSDGTELARVAAVLTASSYSPTDLEFFTYDGQAGGLQKTLALKHNSEAEFAGHGSFQGGISSGDTLTVQGDIIGGGDAYFNSNLSIAGTFQAQSGALINGLTANTGSVFSGGAVFDTIYVTSTLTADDGAIISDGSGNLTVSSVALSNGLTGYNGQVLFDNYSNLHTNGDIGASGGLTIGGVANFGDTVHIDNQLTVAGNVTVDGYLYAGGQQIVGPDGIYSPGDLSATASISAGISIHAADMVTSANGFSTDTGLFSANDLGIYLNGNQIINSDGNIYAPDHVATQNYYFLDGSRLYIENGHLLFYDNTGLMVHQLDN